MNSSHFEVERSEEGIEFEKIGEVEAAGNSIDFIRYDFTDTKPHRLSYYRLKQVDTDESYEYSNVIVINRKDNSDSYIDIYPNPTLGEVNIDLYTVDEIEVTVSVYNLWGSVVKEKSYMNIQGSTTLQMNIEDLASGVYFIKVNTGKDQFETVRVVKE